MSSAAAHRHDPDHEARAGRRDHHAVRLPDLRVARPAEDGLPRACATSPSSTTRSPTSRRNRGETIVIEDLDVRRSGHLRAAGPRRHARRVPARRRPDARAAALAAPGRPSTTSPRSSRCTGPGPMGANAHNDYADRKNGRKPVVPIHPELDEPLREILGETYGLVVYQEQVMAIARQVAGYSLASADLLRRAMGKKKKKELEEQYATFSAGMAERGFSAGRGQGAVGRPAAVLRLRLQQEPRRRLRGRVVLDGLPQGELPGRVHGRAAHLGARRQGQVGDLPGRVPADGHQGAAAVRELLRRRLHPDRHRHPLRPHRDPQRRHATSSARSSPRARPRAPSPTSATSCARSTPSVCNKRTIEALIKGGAFDSLGHPRRGLINVYEAAVDAVLDTKRAEAIGQFDLFGSLGESGPADDVFAVRVPPRGVGQEGAAAVRARDARAVRLRPPAVRARARPRRGGRHDDRGRAGRGQRRAAVGHPDRHPSPRSTAASPRRARRGRRPCSRISRARSR